MALLLVLTVVALLSALLTEFAFSTLVDLRATETFRDRAKAYYLARGGIEAGRMILREDTNSFDHPSEFWGDEMTNISAGDGSISLQIADLNGRMNLNFIADNKGNRLSSYHRFVALCKEVLEIDQTEAEQLADSLLYWLDADRSKVTPDDEFYAAQQPAYQRKGGKLESLDELALVRGFDRDRLRRLRPFIRVFGKEPINLNSASAEVLYAWQFAGPTGTLEIIFDWQDIRALTDYRQNTAYRELSDLGLADGIGDRWAAAWQSGSVQVGSTLFEISSSGRVNQSTRHSRAIVMKESDQLLSLKVE